MNNPDHIFQSLEPIFLFFWVKILKFFGGSGIRDGDSSDPGTGMEKSRIWDKHPGSATLIFWVKILKFFDAYPGSEMEKIWIRDTALSHVS
jgi:hypothetical protein